MSLPDIGAVAVLDEPAPSAAAVVQAKATPYAWYAVGFVTLAATLSVIDRQVLALMIGPIKRDLHISDTQIGLLGGLAYSLFYTLLTLPAAWLADQRSRRMVINGGVFLWSVMTALCGFAGRFSTLFLARMGVGVGEAALAPAAFSMMSDLFPRRTLPIAIGLFSAAPFIGVGLANILGGPLVQGLEATPPIHLGALGEFKSWQITFMIVGLPGVLMAVVGWLTLREPARRGRTAGDAHVPLSLGEILTFLGGRWRFLTLHFTAFIALAIQGWCLFFWVVEFLVRERGASRRMVGLTYGLMALTLGLAGSVVAGQLATRLLARGQGDATMKLILFAALGLAPLAVLMPLAPHVWQVFALLTPMTFLMAWPSGLGPTALQFIVPNELKGRIIALYLVVVNFVSLTLGPLLGGLISDRLFGGKSLGGSLSLMAAVDYPLAALCILLALKPFREAVAAARKWDET